MTRDVTDKQICDAFDGINAEISDDVSNRVVEICVDLIERLGTNAALAISMTLVSSVSKHLISEHIGSDQCAHVAIVRSVNNAMIDMYYRLGGCLEALDAHNREPAASPDQMNS